MQLLNFTSKRWDGHTQLVSGTSVTQAAFPSPNSHVPSDISHNEVHCTAYLPKFMYVICKLLLLKNQTTLSTISAQHNVLNIHQLRAQQSYNLSIIH